MTLHSIMQKRVEMSLAVSSFRYIKLDIKIKTTNKAPYFLGSALRGAFGYALKKVVCINPSYKCEECFAKESCLYYEFYELQNSYHSYRFDVKFNSETFDFSLFLFEDSCQKLPYILSALDKMLHQVGLTSSNLTFENIKIRVEEKEIYDGKEFNLDGIRPKEFKVETHSSDLTLNLITPLRIKKNNKLLRNDIDLETILRSIHQRERQLCYSEKYAKLDYTPNYTIFSSSLYHKTIIRKSNRQKSNMNMDGIMGQIIIKDLDPTSYRLLKLGEIIGVGKQTVMSLGSISIT